MSITRITAAAALACAAAVAPVASAAPASAATYPSVIRNQHAWGTAGDRYEIKQVRISPLYYQITATIVTAPRTGAAAKAWPHGVPASISCPLGGGVTDRATATRRANGSMVAKTTWWTRIGYAHTCTFKKGDTRTTRSLTEVTGRS